MPASNNTNSDTTTTQTTSTESNVTNNTMFDPDNSTEMTHHWSNTIINLIDPGFIDLRDNVMKVRNTLANIRKILNGVRYTPVDTLFHGVVLMKAFAKNVETSVSLGVDCNAGILVHPINSPPLVWYSNVTRKKFWKIDT